MKYEPDLQVLAATVPHINDVVLLAAVGIGVGLFLAICMLRIVTGFKLRWLLIVFYLLLFVLAFFTDSDFLSIAFDSGGKLFRNLPVVVVHKFKAVTPYVEQPRI